MLESWNEVRAWRKLTRSELIAKRRAVSRRDKRRHDSLVARLLKEHEPVLLGKRLGFYWPMNGEISLVTYMRGMLVNIREAALPVVVQRGSPLEFWRWSARTELRSRGLWHVPAPIRRVLVEPEVLLIPMVGFDEAGYRLGYGGGYYDRTLAALAVRPITIGIAHEMGRLETIYPQPHDIPLDAIVTEDGLRGKLDAADRRVPMQS